MVCLNAGDHTGFVSPPEYRHPKPLDPTGECVSKGLGPALSRILNTGVIMPSDSDEKPARIANNAWESAISVSKLSKIYAGGHAALTDIDLEIRKGEIFALLGPNGAGKTTLISIICGIVNPTSGRITAGGDDVIRDYRKTRAKIGLVPQELTTDAFETVWNTVSFSRGLFGKKPDIHRAHPA
jgi:ABC-type multidrug transport system fused ATPase/permease subunit